MRKNPLLVLQGMFHKLDAAFSWRLNPLRGGLAQTAYSVAYIPVAVLGLVGMFLARRQRETILIGMLFVAFICVTAIFWAHTSHRSYLDVYWIVFAASVVERAWTALTPSRLLFPRSIQDRESIQHSIHLELSNKKLNPIQTDDRRALARQVNDLTVEMDTGEIKRFAPR
jgi:hypothetical protein